MSTWADRHPMGECPNEPEDPVSEDTYDAWIAAIDALIQEAPVAAQDSAPADVEALPDAHTTVPAPDRATADGLSYFQRKNSAADR
jgi:hypothetical protein